MEKAFRNSKSVSEALHSVGFYKSQRHNVRTPSWSTTAPSDCNIAFCNEFTFNLGCHFFDLLMLTHKSVKLSDMEELDSGLCCRVGNYAHDGSHDIWWSLDSSQISTALEQAVAAIECAFEDCIQKWGPDGKLLLKSHVKNRIAAIRLSRHLQRWMLGKGSFERFAFVALLAHYHGDLELQQQTSL
ncbi:MAG: hypothetical protein U0894_19555 [Pirellulales bacterium]